MLSRLVRSVGVRETIRVLIRDVVHRALRSRSAPPSSLHPRTQTLRQKWWSNVQTRIGSSRTCTRLISSVALGLGRGAHLKADAADTPFGRRLEEALSFHWERRCWVGRRKAALKTPKAGLCEGSTADSEVGNRKRFTFGLIRRTSIALQVLYS